MIEKRRISQLILVSFLLLISSLVFVDPINLGVCSQYDYDCDNMIAGVAVPVGLFSLISLFILILIRGMNVLVLKAWLRFTKYYLPIAAVLIFLSPTTDSSIFGFDKEFMTWLFSGVFFVVSLAIIIFKRRS